MIVFRSWKLEPRKFGGWKYIHGLDPEKFGPNNVETKIRPLGGWPVILSHTFTMLDILFFSPEGFYWWLLLHIADLSFTTSIHSWFIAVNQTLYQFGTQESTASAYSSKGFCCLKTCYFIGVLGLNVTSTLIKTCQVFSISCKINIK